MESSKKYQKPPVSPLAEHPVLICSIPSSPYQVSKCPHVITSLEMVMLLLDLGRELLEDFVSLLDLGVALLLDLSCAPLLDWGGSLLLDLGDLLDEDDSGDSVESGRASTSSLESGRLSTVSGEALFSMVESAFSVGCSCDMAVSGVALEVEPESQPTMVKSGMTIVATEMILEILI